MYLDKLDGRIEAAYFDRKAAEWRRDLNGLAASIRERRSADRNYLEGGARLLELAAHAHELFLSQAPSEKRKLLNFVVADASLRGGHLTATPGLPFSLISDLAPRAETEPR
jgi:site-specific DNA recombinase